MNTFTYLPPYANSPPLCDARGRLNADAVGWSSRPQTLCSLPGNTGRRKRWNHWCINAPGWMLSLTIADLDYLGYGAIYFLDLETGRSVHRTQITPLGLGCDLPDVPNQSHGFQHGDLCLNFSEQPGQLRITASAPDLGGQPLDLALEIRRPAHLESVNLNVPMAGRCFHACSRQMGLPVRGSLQLGHRTFQCSEGASFAALDFGRGVWPFRTHWTRAAFAAPGGIAGNFGSGWTDHTDLSENALWFGGELQRLSGEVDIQRPSLDALAPWRLLSQCQRVDLTFTPRKLHRACPRLGPLFAETSQWFGHFDGFLRSLDGERVPVRKALGWIGATNARW